MPVIPDIIHTLDHIKELHKKKNDAYAGVNGPFFNFDVQEYVMNLFKNDRDKIYAGEIGKKLARIATLINSNSDGPEEEPVEDSFIDMATYILIWKADRKERRKKRIISEVESKKANTC